MTVDKLNRPYVLELYILLTEAYTLNNECRITYTDCYGNQQCISTSYSKMHTPTYLFDVLQLLMLTNSERYHFFLFYPQNLTSTWKSSFVVRDVHGMIRMQVRIQGGGPGGPGPPLTLGFEAPKLSIFGPYLIFP